MTTYAANSRAYSLPPTPRVPATALPRDRAARAARPGAGHGLRLVSGGVGDLGPRVGAAEPAIASGGDAPAARPPTPTGEVPEATFARAVREQVGVAAFERYFAKGVEFEADGEVVSVVAGTPVQAGVLERRFGRALAHAAVLALGPRGRAAVRAAGAGPGGAGATVDAEAAPVTETSPAPAPAPARASGAAARGPGAGRGRGRAGRLEDFLVGETNRLAYNAAVRLAENAPEARAFSPLFLHGPCGVGKTHLLQGVAQRFKELHPGANVRVTSGEAFMNEFVGAIRSAGERGAGGGAAAVERFRKQYRRCDVLCIDDVHFLASKQATQDELLHTFDEIQRSGALVVLVSDQHPRLLKRFSPALVSRFMSGMVAGIEAPDAPLRERLFRLFAGRRGMVLEDAAARLLVERTRTIGVPTADGPGEVSIREMEGIVTRLDALCRLMPQYLAADGRVGALAAERAFSPSGLGDGPGAAGSGPSRPVRIERVIAYACAALNVEVSDLGGRTRHKRVVLARALITHLARALTTLSFPEIARAIGRPSHSTVITAYQRFAQQLASEETVEVGAGEPVALATLVRRLMETIGRGG